jgi:putative holliday junction resolvase
LRLFRKSLLENHTIKQIAYCKSNIHDNIFIAFRIFADIFFMGRILAIDYGQKRTGIAVTDPLQIIANGLTTIHSKDVIEFLKNYLAKEEVDCIVVGEPFTLQNKASDASRFIEPFVKSLSKHFPGINVERVDERFTSSIAMQSMIDSGLKKKQRQNKELVDTISATLILQSYMEQMSNSNSRK